MNSLPLQVGVFEVPDRDNIFLDQQRDVVFVVLASCILPIWDCNLIEVMYASTPVKVFQGEGSLSNL
jgi:hypothetical protein